MLALLLLANALQHGAICRVVHRNVPIGPYAPTETSERRRDASLGKQVVLTVAT